MTDYPVGRQWVEGNRGHLPPDVAAMLRRARQRKGLSLRAVARRIESAGITVARLERSERRCSTVYAAALADALGLNPAERAALMAVSADNAGRSGAESRKASAESQKASAEPLDPGSWLAMAEERKP